MTNEEAIAIITEAIEDYVCNHVTDTAKAQKMLNAIQTLEQEPSGDLIQRQAVLETLDDMDNVLDEDRTIENYKELLKECYEVLPPVNPQDPKYCDRNICMATEYNGIGCDECEVTKSQELCEDVISREELLKAINTWDRFGVDDTNSLFRLDNLSLPYYVAYIHYDDVVKSIKGMTSVKPQEKTGHWKLQPSNKEQGERDFIWWKCSKCGQVIFSETEKDRREYHAFCGRCGAKMIEEQERSE